MEEKDILMQMALSAAQHLSPERRTYFLGESEAAVTWVCDRCGIIRPLCLGRLWLRRLCACDRARIEQQRQIELHKEQQELIARLQRSQVFSWLAPWQRYEAYREGRYSFTTFSTQALPSETGDPDRRERIVQALREWSTTPQGNVLLVGPFGTGKTHLLVATCYELIDRGYSCLFASVPLLFDAIQDLIHRDEDHQRLIRRAINTPILFLDDIDKVKPTPAKEQALYTILNERMIRGKPTAVSANHGLDTLSEWIGGASVSRLLEGLTFVSLEGLTDYRVTKVRKIV
ncbi:MAG: ATP-binding protein [Acidobacterium ailaaui]|nr:ATP-binding protein [Pseudacidobacterium ailaaui]